MGCLISGIFSFFLFSVVASATSALVAIGLFIFIIIILALVDEDVKSSFREMIADFNNDNLRPKTKQSMNDEEVRKNLEEIEKINIELEKVDENITEKEAEKLLETLQELNKRLDKMNEAIKK